VAARRPGASGEERLGSFARYPSTGGENRRPVGVRSATAAAHGRMSARLAIVRI
jgi:hypothetical protein